MNINSLKTKYEEDGPMALSYQEMRTLFNEVEDLSLENELLLKKVERLEHALLQIVQTDTLSVAKRTARISLG